MRKVSPILLAFTTPGPETPDYLFWCPGCKHGHAYWVTHPCPNKLAKGAQWQFNGNLEKPTFTPSFRVMKVDYSDPENPREIGTICHLFVTDGLLHYCGDCEHEFSGKVIPMEAF